MKKEQQPGPAPTIAQSLEAIQANPNEQNETMKSLFENNVEAEAMEEKATQWAAVAEPKPEE
jgi:hypothetical protein